MSGIPQEEPEDVPPITLTRRKIDSEPPNVKVTKLWNEAITDVSCMFVLGTMLVTKTCPVGLESAAFWSIVAIGGGAQVLQALGKRGSAAVAIIGFIPTVVKALITHRVI